MMWASWNCEARMWNLTTPCFSLYFSPVSINQSPITFSLLSSFPSPSPPQMACFTFAWPNMVWLYMIFQWSTCLYLKSHTSVQFLKTESDESLISHELAPPRGMMGPGLNWGGMVKKLGEGFVNLKDLGLPRCEQDKGSGANKHKYLLT